MVGRGDRLEGRRHAAGEPDRTLVVLADSNRLQGIRALIRDEWLGERPVHRSDRNEAGNVGDRIRDAGAVVVVVREPALRVRVIERRREGHGEPVRKRLIHVGPQSLTLEPRVADDPAVTLHIARQEVARIPSAARHIELGLVVHRLLARDVPQMIVRRQHPVHLVGSDQRAVPEQVERRRGVEHARVEPALARHRQKCAGPVASVSSVRRHSLEVS